MNIIRLNNLGDISNKLIPKIISDGKESIVHGNGNEMNCHELNSVMVSFDSPNLFGNFYSMSQMAFSLAEMIYVLSGRTDNEIMQYYFEQFRIEDDGYGFFTTPVSKRVYELYGDQVYNSFRELKKSKGATSAVINLFMNTPGWIGHDCSLAIQFTVNNENELETHISYRAVDVINYLRSDILIYSVLHSLMANWLSIKPGSMIVYTPKMYILENNLEAAKNAIKQSQAFKDNSTYEIPLRSDSVIGNRKLFSYAVDLINQWHRNSELDYYDEIENSHLPEFLKHILKVLYIIDNIKDGEISDKLRTLENSVLRQNILFFQKYKVDDNLEVN
ncbi:thymidylate synthase [Oceanobacillus luteolus]|uniref:Thymidylate synthase n=1 Tax=Oceanobacillus luteolus TaxID=1274358 RepID=A0ABW4HVI1_9BACI